MQFTMADLTLAIELSYPYTAPSMKRNTRLGKGQSARNIYAVLDLCGLLLATVSG
jgi:hypothetical protein